MSVGSVPKCCRCIILSLSVISSSTVQIGHCVYEKCQQITKNPLFRNGEKIKK